MKKLVKSVKNSFTLLETIVSTLLLSIIIVGFSNFSFYDNFDEEYLLLNKLENSFNTSLYTNEFSKKNKQLSVLINDTQPQTLNVREIEYSSNKIRIYKYELPK